MSCQPIDEGFAAIVSLKTINAPFDMTISGIGNQRCVELDVGVPGLFLFEFWLSDLPTTPNIHSEQPPDDSATVSWKKVTDPDGSLTECVIHDGDPQTWTVNAVLLGPLGQIAMPFT